MACWLWQYNKFRSETYSAQCTVQCTEYSVTATFIIAIYGFLYESLDTSYLLSVDEDVRKLS